MTLLVRQLGDIGGGEARALGLLNREWLVTNGIGGYSSGTVLGVLTRRYHGLLVAALPSPWGRTMTLTSLSEEVRLPNGYVAQLCSEELMHRQEEIFRLDALRSFRLEQGLPVWEFKVQDYRVERRVVMPYGKNTVHVLYRLLDGEGDQVQLGLRPYIHFRGHDAPVDDPLSGPYRVEATGEGWEISSASAAPDACPPEFLVLRLAPHAAGYKFSLDPGFTQEVIYRIEESRGYPAVGDLWSPGRFTLSLNREEGACLTASTEDWGDLAEHRPETALEAEVGRRSRLLSTLPAAAASDVPGELALAADQFSIRPPGRVPNDPAAVAVGEKVRSVIAGYHWFTDWGRDTMISLEGLALCTGEWETASLILDTFAHYVRDGLIPNVFPEGGDEGIYNTADATLWFFHALDRYLTYTNDRGLLHHLLPKLVAIIEAHLAGTRFGIRVDPDDGLLTQGDSRLPLTWMDAKVEGWVVTPRRGKAVEINALWYNALRLASRWLREEASWLPAEGAREAGPQASGEEPEFIAERFEAEAERMKVSFNLRFWIESERYLYDVVDGEEGDDPSLRPNQLLSISLPHPVLDQGRWSAVVERVERELLTPVGLRTLAPAHPDYKPVYFGDLRNRDAAYHQGTVWPWLIGPFVDAWLLVHPGAESEAAGFLSGLVDHLGDGCVGSVSEIFDAEAPFFPRGCISQAWSVAEVMRCWLKTRPASTGTPASAQ